MRIRRTQRAELPRPENIGDQSVFAPALPGLYSWSWELSHELAKGSSIWNRLCCVLSFGRPSLPRHTCHSMWESRRGILQKKHPRKFTLGVWTMTEKEQEELEGGEDGLSEVKAHQRFLLIVPLCHWIPVDQLHQFSARHLPGLGRSRLSHLAASWPCPTSSAQCTDPVPRLEAVGKGGSQEGRSWLRPPLWPGQLLCSDLEPGTTSPSLCNTNGPSPKDVCVWIISL